MRYHIDFQQSLFAFYKAISTDVITEICKDISQLLGFDNFIYALRIPTQFNQSQIVMIKGFPDPWLEHYFEEAFYSHDPVVRYRAQHVTPLSWCNLNRLDPLMTTNQATARVMNEAKEFGLHTGISMPIHSPQGEFGILSLTLDRSTRKAEATVFAAEIFIPSFAGHLHEAVRRVVGLEEQSRKIQLTSREQECLRWIADGKTSWEIAHLLNMSERTVNFHINNSINKLEASNRQHAVARAILQGVINPNPF